MSALEAGSSISTEFADQSHTAASRHRTLNIPGRRPGRPPAPPRATRVNAAEAKDVAATEPIATALNSSVVLTEPGRAAQARPDLAQAVLDCAYFGGEHLAYVNDAFLVYDWTHWRELSEAELGGAILRHRPVEPARGGGLVRSEVRDATATLKMRCATRGERWHAKPVLPVLPVANGELWVASDGAITLRPHSPASRQRHCLDVTYDPAATCPRFDQALAEIFMRSANPAALVALWHEIVGYLLQPLRRQPRIFVLWGGGRDGKTALVETLLRLIGPGQVASMPVEALLGSRYVLDDLAGKHLFLDPDMATGVTLPDGMLKKLSEGTTVTAERKWRAPITYAMQAVPMIATNHVPRLRDRSTGFRRRLVVIPFERSFDEREVDYGLFPTIHATEMAGVLNQALAGLQRVVRRGWKLDLPEAVTAATDAWWAAATGPAHDEVQPGEASTPATPLTPMRAERQGPVVPHTIPVAPDAEVAVNVDLAALGKGRTVQVTVSATALEVRVGEVPAARNTAPGKLTHR